MFHFLEARMATMLRTSRSLLRMARRHLMKDLREKEELDKKGLPALKASADRGDVDAVVKFSKKELEALSKQIDDLSFMERNTFIAEYRTVRDVVAIQRGFDDAIQQLKKLNEIRPTPALGKVGDAFETMKRQLLADEKLEERELYNQYLAIERQTTHEKGQLQTLVFSVSNIMSLMDRLWQLRGEVRQETRTENDLIKEERRVMSILHELQTEKDQKRVEHLLRDLEANQAHIAGAMMKFTKLFKESELAFTITMKACVDIYFEYLKDEKFFDDFFKTLAVAKFPEHDLQELQALLKKEQEDETQHLRDILAIVQRGSRIESGQLAA